MKHYVYKLIDPRSGETFYIGKGTNGRMKQHVQHVKNKKQSYKNKNPHRYNKIKSILESGYDDLEYEKPYEYEESEKAFEKEKDLIAEHTLENLTNICEGRDGGYNPEAALVNKKIRSGSTWEEIYGEEKAKEIKKNRRKRYEENGAPCSGKSFEEIHGEQKAKRLRKKFAMNAKEQHTGKTRSEETRKKISEGIRKSDHAEKMKDPELRERLSQKQKENWQDPEYRKKQCKKLSKAQKKRWKEKGRKLTKGQVRESLENSNTVAAARRYARDNYEEVSRPTFDKYIEEYGLDDLKEQVVSSSGY